MNNLRDRFKKINSRGIHFMDNRTKGNIEKGKWFTLDEFDFITTSLGESLVFTVKENIEFYYFGTPTITSKFKEMQKEFTFEEFKQLKEEGIQILITIKTSKSNRKYTTIFFK